MPQVGVYSAYQLGIHNHLNDTMGGILNAYSRYGAYRTPYRTGALSIHCDNDAERSDSGASTVLLKETLINTGQEGRYRISWQMKNSDNVTVVSTWFFVNGLAVSANQDSSSNVYATKTYNYDVNLNAGDLLQIYGDAGAGADTVWVRNFRVYYDWGIAYFGDGTFNNLVTLLPLSDADLLDFTVII